MGDTPTPPARNLAPLHSPEEGEEITLPQDISLRLVSPKGRAKAGTLFGYTTCACDRGGTRWPTGTAKSGRPGYLTRSASSTGFGVAEFLEEAGLGPGMTMVDYGCGPGFVTLQAAKMLGPAGKVYGLDIHEGMVALARSRAAGAGLANVTTLLNDGPQAPLPDSVADLVTCILVLHYKESPRERQAVVSDIARLLKPGGRVVVIQWADRVTYEETLEMLTAAGLECEGPYSVVDNRYRVSGVKRR